MIYALGPFRLDTHDAVLFRGARAACPFVAVFGASPLPNLSAQRKKERTLNALLRQLESVARASDINRVSEKFRRFFGSASRLAATQGTNCRSSVAVSDKGSVCADDVMRGLGTASKLNADVRFLSQLRALGRERAQAWIDHHG
jgi:hypothetical protein